MSILPHRASLRRLAALYIAASCLAIGTNAHEHHDADIPDGSFTTPEPLDTILWIHIMVQIAAWGIIFPTGMVLGIIRSRWHIPVQVLGTSLAIVGYYLGHHHKGRQFSKNVHSQFAPALAIALFAQIILGIYLKLHIERGILGRIRPWLVTSHGILGKAMPLAAWVQMIFGGITALGFCHADHTGQCLAHFIMGSAFIAYGIILTILLLVGQYWLRRTGRSQEFFDSTIIAAWGMVNTFTEHHWGDPWVHNDLQHTTMGVIWWAAGLTGMWLSRRRDGTPKRNVIPGIVLIMTGYGMSAHPQALMLSTMIHSFFGYTLMLAGLTRIIEICFILGDRSNVSMDGSNPHSFQYIPAFLLYASGFLFMGATEEQMALLSAAGVTHVSYILILYSIAFILFLFVNVLLHMYAQYAFPLPASGSKTVPQGSRSNHRKFVEHEDDDEEAGAASLELDDFDGKHGDGDAVVKANGNGNGNGHMSERERQRAREAEEFELDALISDDDDQEEHVRQRTGRRAG